MKSHALLAAAVGMFALPAPGASVSLSGTILNPDSTARSGVIVSLSGTSLTTTSGANGKWSLTGTTSLLPSWSGSASKPLTRHVVLDGGRLRLSFGDRDINGRSLSGVDAVSSAPAGVSSARAASSALDTLVYSWNGTAILRDTIGEDNLSQKGILRIFDTTVNAAIAHGYLTDSRDGRLYRTMRSGTQTWMAQNMNFITDSSVCPLDSAPLCAEYGRLYTWRSAMGACPLGWHVPNDTEWSTLFAFVGKDSAAAKLKSVRGWSPTSEAMVKSHDTLILLQSSPDGALPNSDSYGFHALPAGTLNFETDSTSMRMGWTRAYGVGWSEIWSSTIKISNTTYSVSAGTTLMCGAAACNMAERTSLDYFIKEFASDVNYVLENIEFESDNGIDANSVRCLAD